MGAGIDKMNGWEADVDRMSEGCHSSDRGNLIVVVVVV